MSMTSNWMNIYVIYIKYLYIYITSHHIEEKKNNVIKYNDKRETFKFDRKLENGRQKLYDDIAWTQNIRLKENRQTRYSRLSSTAIYDH